MPDNRSTPLNIRKRDKATLSNVLNEMIYEKKMSLQEFRLFLLYLAKIDPQNPNQTEITFSLQQYSALLGVELNESALFAVMDKLLKRLVSIRPEVMPDYAIDGRIRCQLFSKCFMFKAKSDGKWYMSFKCHDDIKPYLFDFKGNFTEFEFWNAINLHSFHKIRLYMLLKQYYRIGERVIDLQELKRMLGIAPHEFPEYKIFARSVLKKCQTALKKNSDLMFDYKPIGRPAQAVRFMIYENTSFVLPDTLSASNMIFPSQGIIEKSHTYSQYYQHPIPSWPVLSEQTDQMKLLFQINKQAFFEEFDYSTMEYLIEIIKKMYPLPQICNADFLADYLKQVIPDLRIFYLQMSRAAASPLMRARSNYLAKILLNECTSRLGFSYSNTSHKYTYKGSHDNRFGFERRDYDLSEIEHLLLM